MRIKNPDLVLIDNAIQQSGIKFVTKYREKRKGDRPSVIAGCRTKLYQVLTPFLLDKLNDLLNADGFTLNICPRRKYGRAITSVVIVKK